MSKYIKELTEKRGAKLNEARTLVEAVKAENRELSADELQKVAAIHTEAERMAETIQLEARQIAAEGRKFDLSANESRDVAKFSLARMLSRMASGQQLDGAEAEFAAEGEREARAAGITPRGIMVSPLALTRRDMTATGGTALKEGGMTVATGKANLLDDLFDRMVLVQAGATVLNGLVGNLDIPRLTKDATGPVKKTEVAQSGELSPTTAMLSLSPKRLPAVIEVSNQLMKQSSAPALEAVIRRHLESHISQVVQRALLHGGGTAEPRGVAATTGIGSVAGGTNGAAPDYADIVNLQKEVAIDDADFGRLAFVTNAKVEAKLKLTAKVASTDSVTIIDSFRNISMLDGRPYYLTNSVSSTLTKAGSGAVCSAIFYGNWQDLWIANWAGIEFLVNPFSKDDYGLTRINAAIYYDGGVVRPVSFSAMLDALT